MTRPGPPSSQPVASPRLPQHAAGVRPRPVRSLDRIEVTVRHNAWDVYRMEMAERWQRSHSADAPVIASTFPLAVVLYFLLDIFYMSLTPAGWKNAVLPGTMWLLVLWGSWWGLAPYFAARRQAEAALSEPPVRFVFSPECVEMIRLDVSTQIAWPGIRRVKETWFSFLIYPRQSSPYATPTVA